MALEWEEVYEDGPEIAKSAFGTYEVAELEDDSWALFFDGDMLFKNFSFGTDAMKKTAEAHYTGMIEMREEIAKSVHEAMLWVYVHTGTEPVSGWGDGGNSPAKKEARRIANEILDSFGGG